MGEYAVYMHINKQNNKKTRKEGGIMNLDYSDKQKIYINEADSRWNFKVG